MDGCFHWWFIAILSMKSAWHCNHRFQVVIPEHTFPLLHFEHTHLRIQWVAGTFFPPGPGCEAEHLPQSSTKVDLYSHSSYMSSKRKNIPLPFNFIHFPPLVARLHMSALQCLPPCWNLYIAPAIRREFLFSTLLVRLPQRLPRYFIR